MNLQLITQVLATIVAVILIILVALQPSQKTGLIGDVSDVEKTPKRGFQLFLFRATIIFMICLFGFSIIYGMGIGGAF